MKVSNNFYGTGRGTVAFDYESAQDLRRRKAPRTTARNEDRVLTPQKRKRVEETATDQARNFPLLAWMIRHHIDFVSQFTPQVRSGNPRVDEWLRRKIEIAGRRKNFDVAGRFSRSQAMRFFELHKILEGDAALVEIRGGFRQVVEGRMIGRPQDLPKRWDKRVSDNGLVINPRTGRVEYYCLQKWDESGSRKVYGRMVKAEDITFDAYFPRINSSRGVSPLATALNQLADLHENFEYTLLKIKQHAMFGVKITRDAGEGDGFSTVGSVEDDDDADGEVANGSHTEIELGHSVLTLNLDPGEDANTIESQTPSSEFVNFSELMIRSILLALDIPYTAFDSMKASFSARIADRQEYEFSAKSKREKNKDILNELTERDIRRWMDEGLGELLREEGMSMQQAIGSVKWIAIGSPWMDKLKEVLGDEKAISIGIESGPNCARRRGEDAYEMIDEQAAFLEYAASKGVPIAHGAPGQVSVGERKINEDEEGES